MQESGDICVPNLEPVNFNSATTLFFYLMIYLDYFTFLEFSVTTPSVS